MNFESSSFKEGRVRDRLENLSGAITDMAIGCAFEDSDDIGKALAELED